MAHEEPMTAFSRSNANSITGGFVYRGTDIPELFGQYICADYGIGDEIYAVDTITGDYLQIGTFLPQDIISFGQDNEGELYLLRLGQNTNIYKLKPNEVDYSSVPQLLSETGVFSNLSTLDVNDGIIPYELHESFWSDGALKRRWIAIPNNGTHDTAEEQIKYSENGDWEFPAGSVLIKHFDLQTNENDPYEIKKIETRFSIVDANGKMYFLTYNWNESQTDAVLQTASLDEPVDIITGIGTRTQTWHFPSNSECIACHNTANKGGLGLKTRYLNNDYTYDETGITANQLVTLSHLGIIDETITDAVTSNLLSSKSIYDPAATLDEKARSYLDLNCAYCHRADNNNRASFDLRLVNSIEATELLSAGILTPLGIPDEKILFPGDASKSILFHRMNSVDPTIMMPPLAKSIVDQDAVDLIEEWINQLEAPLNSPNDLINLALLPEAILTGSVTGGRGTPEVILYNPAIDDYDVATAYNEYGVNFGQNLGKPDVDNGFKWQVNWTFPKYINYVTFGGVYPNQPQPNALWRISYRNQGVWITLNEGQGGWLNAGIFEWGGANQTAIIADALRVQVYSDGINDVQSIHLRARGGVSNNENDATTTPKATLIQYLLSNNNFGLAVSEGDLLYSNGQWLFGNEPSETTAAKNTYIINGTYTIDQDLDIAINKLQISLGATLIVKEGASLTLNDNLLNEGALQLESIATKYSSLIVEGTSTGTISYKRHVNAYDGSNLNDLVSAPLSGQTFSDFARSNPNLFENPVNTKQKLFGPFVETSGMYQTYSTSINADTTLDKGIGFRAARDDSEDGARGTTLTFTGTLETNSFDIPISETTRAFSGWNLIGNPYPSYIDFQTFFNLNKTELNLGIYQAIYSYGGNASNRWSVWNNLSADKLIAPGQGFFVKSKTNGGAVTFKPSMRIKGITDDFILGRSNPANLGFITVGLSNRSAIFKTDLYFHVNATLGLDPGYDAALFGGITSDFCLYSNLIEGNTGDPLAIQAVGNQNINDLIVPLGIHAPQGQQVAISITESTIPEYINVYLEDRLNNTFTLLNAGAYRLTPQNNLIGVGRFYLNFVGDALNPIENTLNTLNIFTNQRQKTIVIEGQLKGATNFKLFDIHGRIVNSKALETSNTNQAISVAHLSAGVYIIELITNNTEKRIEKCVIK